MKERLVRREGFCDRGLPREEEAALLRAAAEAHEVQRAEERAAIEIAQRQLQQAGHQLQRKDELHRRQQEALSAQAEEQRRELAHFEARLRQEIRIGVAACATR